VSPCLDLRDRIEQALPLGLAAPRQGLRPYQRDTAFIPWACQGALLAEFACSRGLERTDWLAQAEVRQGQALSPRQLLALLLPLQQGAKDSAFVIGQLSLPGHYGLASQALQQADNLLDALRILCRYAARLSPLLTPRLLVHERELVLYWTEACGAPTPQRAFLVDLHMSAVTAMAQWLGGRRLPWSYSFNRTRPADLSQHAVYLGRELRFDCQVDAMRLGLDEARRPWPGRAGRPDNLALQALGQGADPEAERRGLLAALYDHLLPQVADTPSLEQAAAVFEVSTATLKRHLARHGTHFQAEFDQLRAHVALCLLHLDGQANEAVARALGFYDAINFRRSFRRWTGGAPGLWAVGG